MLYIGVLGYPGRLGEDLRLSLTGMAGIEASVQV